VIVFARLFNDGKNYGVFPFLVSLRTGDSLNITENISIEWMGKVIGERTHRQYLIRFNNFEISANALVNC